jgi:predicted HicB family RNase H-like nuclease
MREKLNLTFPPELIEAAKIQAIKEKRSVSEIVEEILRKYLQQKSEGKKKTK